MKCNAYRRTRVRAVAITFLLAAITVLPAQAQKLDNFERDRGRLMLNNVKNEIKKSYYDPNFHGLDVDARFKEAEEKLKQATSLGQVFGIIAQAVLDLNDSHTMFYPPSRATRIDYGWHMQAIGENCYVVAVKPGSDAEAKGLKVGDMVYSVDGFGPVRDNLKKLQYLYYTLRPKPVVRVVVHSPDGRQREMDLMASVKQEKLVYEFTSADLHKLTLEQESEARLLRQRYTEVGDELFIWKMPQFDLQNINVNNMMEKVRKRKTLVLDLRGNPGGYEVTLQRMLGHFFDRDIKIGDVKGRKETKPLMAKTQADKCFKGKLIVLVDSGSGSSAEIFARMIQLEKRGIVIGDKTAGAVMRARGEVFTLGIEGASSVAYYAVSVTDADLIMSDGKSLERVGVTPDELLLPTAADLAAGRDPVLVRAAELAGVRLEPEKAGALFPIEWRK